MATPVGALRFVLPLPGVGLYEVRSMMILFLSFDRLLTLFTVTAGIVLSIMASANCNFLKFRTDADEPWEGLEPPFENALEAHVGIFGYEINRHLDESEVTDGCVGYENTFSSADFEVLISAQFCAVFAPIFAVLGLLVSCLDTFFCRFFMSFLIASAFFLAACGVQAGTFSLFAEPSFWYVEM